jgi:hypothetical protein
LGKDFVSLEQQETLIRVVDTHLKEHFTRAQQRLEKRNDEDYDEGVEEILEDEVCYIYRFPLCDSNFAFSIFRVMRMSTS